MPPQQQLGALAEAARRALDTATSTDELLSFQTHVDAMIYLIRNLVRDQQASLAEQNMWAALKFEAQRRIGEWLRDRKTGSSQDARTLSELGINYDKSWRWQRLAQLSDERFRREVERVNREGRELTQAGLLKVWEKNHGAKSRRQWVKPLQRQKSMVRCPKCGHEFTPPSQRRR